jgi:hypothetical protein
LLQKRRYVLAGSDWAQFAGGSPGQVFNGGFEKEPTGAAMYWVISPSKSSETIIDESAAYEGKRALHIRFQADENVIYRNVSQVVLLDPGTYELRARVKIDRITTDEGPRLQIDDVEGAGRLGVRTAPFVGTIPWTDVIQRFVVPPGSGGIVLRVVRLPSNKFDNKIGGDFWMDAVLLARL